MFQYNGGAMLGAANAKRGQQQSFFDSIARGIQNYQHGQNLELKKEQILADQQAKQAAAAQKANDPKVLAESGMMKLAQGQDLTPQEQAAVKVFDAKQRPFVDPTTGNMMGAASVFDKLTGRQTAQQPIDKQGFDFNMLIGKQGQGSNPALQNGGNYGDIQPNIGVDLSNNPKAKQVELEETIKQRIRDNSANKKLAAKEEERQGARASFDDQLEKVLHDLDELKAQGGTKTIDQSKVKNIGAALAEAPFVGSAVQSTFDPETQTLRDKIDGMRPVLFNQIKKASGLTGGELNSQFEVENQLKQLGNSGMTYEARRDLLRNLSSQFGTGRLSAPEQKSALEGLSKEERYELWKKAKGQ